MLLFYARDACKERDVRSHSIFVCVMSCLIRFIVPRSLTFQPRARVMHMTSMMIRRVGGTAFGVILTSDVRPQAYLKRAVYMNVVV